MLGLSIDGPGSRTADPVPDDITRKPALDKTECPSIDLFWLLAQTTQNKGRGLYPGVTALSWGVCAGVWLYSIALFGCICDVNATSAEPEPFSPEWDGEGYWGGGVDVGVGSTWTRCNLGSARARRGSRALRGSMFSMIRMKKHSVVMMVIQGKKEGISSI